MAENFAVVGVAGYIAPRHLKAICDTGNHIVAAMDPHDAVGILDQYAFDVRFFTEIERFDRHLEKLKRGPASGRVQWISICSPNYLHDAHIRLALRVGAQVLCEKPLVINPWNLDQLEAIEAETRGRVNTVLQLRVHPALTALRDRLQTSSGKRHQVRLTYVTGRGAWYHTSWKGVEERSGGVATNIGIHFFDLLWWLFGGVAREGVHLRDPRRLSGYLEMERADVTWFLSVDPGDLPFDARPGQTSTYRSMTVDGEEIDFTQGFADLHTRVYERTLAGRGFGIADARPSIELAFRLRTAPVIPPGDLAHPYLATAGKEAMP